MHHWKAIIFITTALISTVFYGSSMGASGDTRASISDVMRKIVDSDGWEAAEKGYHSLRATGPERYNSGLSELDRLAAEYFGEGKNDIGLALSRLNAEAYPDSICALLSAARACHHLGRRSEARDYIDRAFELDTLSLKTLVQKKRIYFVPLDFDPPRLLATDEFLLRPLTASDAELDYKAVMSSVDHLTGVLGRRDWPGELTLEEDRYALAGHEREFEVREGFVYTVMNPDQTECLGCVYIYPSRWDDFDAEVIMWVSQRAFDDGLDPVLVTTVKEWLASDWPFERVVYPGREVNWGDYFDRLDQQDQHRHW